MAIQYNIYQNDGLGGPVDRSTPVATVSGLTWTTAALAAPGEYEWIVLAEDTVSGLESLDAEARASLILDATGADITGRPAPALGVSTLALAGGEAEVTWSYPEGWSALPIPTGFRVWITAGAVVNFAAAPSATVAFGAPGGHYRAVVTGLVGGAAYAVGVRAYNAAADDGNADSHGVIGKTAGPDAPDELTIEATWRS